MGSTDTDTRTRTTRTWRYRETVLALSTLAFFGTMAGRDVATAACIVLAAAGFGLLIAVPGIVAVAAAVVLLGTGLGWGAALLPCFIDVFSSVEHGVGFGLIQTVYGIVGALGSVGTGLLAALAGWGMAFGVLAALLALVVVALAGNWALSLGY